MKFDETREKLVDSQSKIINENSMINDSANNFSNISDSQNQSMMTVYFPDKINIKNNKFSTNKYKVDVPVLDFSNIPIYESESSGEKVKKKVESEGVHFENISESEGNLIKNAGKKIAKNKNNNLINSGIQNKKSKNYKSEFMEKYNECSES